jgi:hypothetical protein
VFQSFDMYKLIVDLLKNENSIKDLVDKFVLQFAKKDGSLGLIPSNKVLF